MAKAERQDGQSLDVRSRILNAAFTLLEADGVAAMTQPRVAAAAGLRQSHLTYYFPKRADLLLAVLQHSHEQADGEIEDADIFERIASLMFSRRRAQFFLAVVTEVSADGDLRSVLAQHTGHFQAEMAALFGKDVASPAIVAFVDEVRGMAIRSLLSDVPLTAADAKGVAERLGLTPRDV